MQHVPVQAEDKSTQLRVTELDNADESKDGQQPKGRARALSDVAKLQTLNESLTRLRPLLVMLSLVDLIKVTWDGRISASTNAEAGKNIQVYHEVLAKEYLSKGNLK